MSIADALFSPAQAKVLTWVFGQPERWFHVNELIRLTGLGSASVQRELKRLEQSGLAQAERVGNLRRYRANAASPVFAEIASLTKKTLAVVPVIQAALEPLRDRIVLALVFGSVAKGTEHAASDIDLLVVSDTVSWSDLLACLAGTESTLGRPVNPSCYTVAEFQERVADPNSFVSRVLAQPLLLLWGSPHGLGAAG
ncbi:nucleotidyltransferase domain-containing protein [Xylophilus sp. Leaf220]|uniref:nucleotidyltransferase domain-containing protein n=1 Tax=Xylophilus sp. Leaf220 TaxID=1735686 RepID=UPI0007008E09|nr:nucleotidyltransferase domain-containing protein [Xylophilus sp. Leaf220]KQM77413.1 hypothetical protein ASE76_18310 [Xylophilus sp. Leaf220]